MFAVVYRWKVAPGQEAAFEAGWLAATEIITEHQGGWGSRLHRAENGVVFAYAQWPDRRTWEAAMSTRSAAPDDPARAAYRASIEPGSFEVVFAGEVVADRLQPRGRQAGSTR